VATKSGQDSSVAAGDVEELLDTVEKTLDRLKTLYEQYFLGIQKQAPGYIHSDVERKLRDLMQMQIRNTGLRYRFNSIQAKFAAYNSYWRRTLRQIENGTYIRNLHKIGRAAARSGADIPEEILAAMPKRMRDQVLKDREVALASARRHNQVEPADDELLSLEDEPAIIKEGTELRRQVRGAHVVQEDDEFDLDAFFKEVESGDADDKTPADQPPVMAPPVRTSTGPAPRPPTAASPPQRATGPIPTVPQRETGPIPTVSQTGPIPTVPEGTTTGPIPVVVDPMTGAIPTLPRATGAIPTLSRATGPIPTVPAQRQTGPIPTVPQQRQTGPIPTVPQQRQTGPVPTIPQQRQTGPIPTVSQTGPVPTVPPIPGMPRGPLAPSQASRPNPIAPGSAAAHGEVPVESMAGPFPRQPTGAIPTVRTPTGPVPSPSATGPVPRQPTGPVPRSQTGPVPRPPGAPRPAPPVSAQSQPTRAIPKTEPTGARTPPGMSDADVNALYAKYVKAKESVGEKVGPGGYGKLLSTINQQAPKIMEQYKAKGVDFSVVVKDNQVIIRAKPKP
jgi:hypothetical protein